MKLLLLGLLIPLMRRKESSECEVGGVSIVFGDNSREVATDELLPVARVSVEARFLFRSRGMRKQEMPVTSIGGVSVLFGRARSLADHNPRQRHQGQ